MIKKYFYSLIILTISFSCNNRNVNNSQPIDSLQKYSYLIYGFYDIKKIGGDSVDFSMKQGTGFFIRKNGKIFLVSAKHVLTPCDPDSAKKLSSFPNEIKIRMIDTGGNYSIASLDISKIKDTVSCDYFYNDPDVFCIEFQDTSGYIINSIENFIKPKVPENDSCKIYLYGFPTLYSKLTQETVLPFKTQKSTLSSGSYYANSMDRRGLNFAMKGTGTLPRAGCSGSPVFFKFRNNGNYVFGGLLIKADTISGYSVMVKSKFVIEKLP